jgi:hypothetical protein
MTPPTAPDILFKAASDAVKAAIDSAEFYLDLNADTHDTSPDAGNDNFLVTLARANQALHAAQEILDGPTGNKATYNALHNSPGA